MFVGNEKRADSSGSGPQFVAIYPADTIIY